MQAQPNAPPYRHAHNHVFVSPRPRCPVCNKVTYSRGGIHPQCSADREGKEQDAALKAERMAAEA
jgi:hypothetical protein